MLMVVGIVLWTARPCYDRVDIGGTKLPKYKGLQPQQGSGQGGYDGKGGL